MADEKKIQTIAGVRIKLRTDTAANWAEKNPVLLKGEFAYIEDEHKFKMGDGDTAWNSLDYAGGGTADIAELARAVKGVKHEITDTDTKEVLSVEYSAATINDVEFDGTQNIVINKFSNGVNVTGGSLLVNGGGNVSIEKNDKDATGGDLNVEGTISGALQQTISFVTAGDEGGTEVAFDAFGASTYDNKSTSTDIKIPVNMKNGLLRLNDEALIDTKYLPSYVDEVISVATYADLLEKYPTGEKGKIYYVEQDETQSEKDKYGNYLPGVYRWSPSSEDAAKGSYVNINVQVGKADSAVKLVTKRNFGINVGTADANITASNVEFDGTGDVNLIADLKTVYTGANSVALVDDVDGAHQKVISSITVDEKGRVTSFGDQVEITPEWTAIKQVDSTTGVLNLGENQGLAKWSDTEYINKTQYTGNAATATEANKAKQLSDAKGISISGDVVTAAAVLFDGTQAIDLEVSIPAVSGLVAGTKGDKENVPVVTVNAKGQVTKLESIAIEPKWTAIQEVAEATGVKLADGNGLAQWTDTEGKVLGSITKTQYTGNAATATTLDTANNYFVLDCGAAANLFEV